MKKYQDLIDAAQEIISDFDMWGEVLQCGPDDADGEYGETSTIEKLRAALRNIG